MSKKGFKRVATVIMAAALMVTGAGGVLPGTEIINDEGVKTASAATVRKSGNFKYVKYLNGVKITKYTGKAKKVTIPAKIAGKKVVAIGKSAFGYNSKIKQVKIPDSVKEIKRGAFEGCSKLKKVTMPKELDEIGSAAFSGTAITKITIPKGIAEVEYCTFNGCKKLKTVVLSDDVKIIDEEAFAGCEKLTTINLDNVEEIGYQSFKNDKSLAGNLSLKNVTVIKNEAFYGCEGITGVEFSDSLQQLGECEKDYTASAVQVKDAVSGMTSSNPFIYCNNMEKFIVDVNNANFTSVDGVLYGKTGEWLVAYPAKKQGDVTIGDNVKGIGEFAFLGAQIGKVTMSKGLNSIGKMAFAKSTVTEVNMPLPDESKAVDWKADAFFKCEALKKVVFPEGVMSSNGVAFYFCTALTDVVLPKTMESLSDSMFIGCTSLQQVVLPEAVKKIPMQCFYKCSALNNINLDNVEHVGGKAFEECKALSGVLNLNITSYDYGAFAECTGITEVNLNKPITSEPDYYYNAMEYLEPVSILAEDEGTTLLGKAAEFDECTYPTSKNPFAACTNLTKINTVDEGAVKSIDGVLYSSDMKKIIAFPGAITGKFNIPYGVEIIQNGAFEGTNISEVVCSNSILQIEGSSFSESKVKAVTISKSVTTIDESFSSCSELEKIDVHSGNNTYESVDGMLCRNNGKNKKLLVYPGAKKGKTLKLAKNIVPEYGVFRNCKYLKKVYFSKLTDLSEDGRFIMFYNCSNIKIYLPKDFDVFDSEDIKLTDSDGYFTYGFDHEDLMTKATCKDCKTYVKKGSKLAKKLDKKKIKYRKY